ncbi:Hint domain-containing protein [Hyalangium sp.]|uniref:Hint domain-containing protein n=1 Tax=Hyalangium sp. TaxID=2028555 RepID=UPI002D365EC5|nr:Hint domain-containing protein [Hyalangium sp.]HYH96402.1 Hint domain-containing protein [Hyalangium sp.]
MIRVRRHLVSVLSGACLAMLFACKSDLQEEQQASTGYSEQGLEEPGRLSKPEWETYMADQSYLHGLTSPDVRVRLNLADPRQHRFAMARLKLAGKTPINSPYLFEAMEKRRQTHLARGYQAGLLPAKEMGILSTADRQEMHLIEMASLGETTAAANDGIGTASSTFPGGAYYTYADVSYTDVSGRPLGSLAWREEFDDGSNVTISATGDLSRTNLRRYRVASYKLEDSAAGFTDSYVYTEVGSANQAGVAEVPRLTGLVVEAPLDIAFNDNRISVCLNRTWTQDCDYDLTGTPQAIKLPLKGSITIASNHLLDTTTINQIKTDLNNNVDRPDAGHVKLILTNVGGGCDVTNNNTLEAKMGQFWNQVAWTANKKTFSWDLTGAFAAYFDDGCRQVQDEAKLTVFVVLPLVDGTGTRYRSTITLSNDPNALRPDYVFKRIEITNSCLAAGTEIELAAGESGPIESLKAGDRVFNPYHPSLTVMDTAAGFETVPMVRIRDEAGRSLLMTEMHPIQVAARGMVQAKALKTGDRVMTRTGPSKLVKVSREAYDGKVYNVKVGSDAEKTALAEDQTVVYANGFMVGDGQIQSKYEAIAMTQKEGPVLARLPGKWHRDYLMSTQGQ